MPTQQMYGSCKTLKILHTLRKHQTYITSLASDIYLIPDIWPHLSYFSYMDITILSVINGNDARKC